MTAANSVATKAAMKTEGRKGRCSWTREGYRSGLVSCLAAGDMENKTEV